MCLIQFEQNSLGVKAKGFPSDGQPHSFSDAVKKVGPKFLFELLNLLGESWLGNVQKLSGTPEIGGVGNGQEVAQVACSIDSSLIGRIYRTNQKEVLDRSIVTR